jgi:dTDP-4-dehydrorhamnose 3,5-epimerase
MEAHGLAAVIAQCNLALTRHQGTVRGLHYQVPPAAEAKLVRCIRGAIYDVIVDLRRESPTYLEHLGVELSADNRLQFCVPEGFAHGYQALADNTEIIYMASQFHAPQHEAGLRYDDPALGIQWPLPVSMVSAKDSNWPLFERSQR